MNVENALSSRLSRRAVLIAGAGLVLGVACGPENNPPRYTINTDGHVDRRSTFLEKFRTEPIVNLVSRSKSDPIWRVGQAEIKVFNDERVAADEYHPINRGYFRALLPREFKENKADLRIAAFLPDGSEAVIQNAHKRIGSASSFKDKIPPEDKKLTTVEFLFKLNKPLKREDMLQSGVIIFAEEVDRETHESINGSQFILRMTT